MALIKLDPIVDKISGKVGGQSFVAGTNGNYIRNNAQTRKGTLNQGYQSKTKTPGVNATWQKLTNAEKQTFIDLVGTYPYINRIDEVRQYSAYQIFMLCAQGTQLINESIKFSGSAFVVIDKPTIEVFVNNSASMTVEILNPQSDIFYAIYATSPQGVGIYSVRRQLRYLGFVTEAIAANKFDISAIYDNKFNAILPFRNYGIMVKPIVLNSGQIGPKSDISISPYLDIPTPPPGTNTFIYGIASIAPDETALSALIGAPVGNMSNFLIIDDDVFVTINASYDLPADAFNGSILLLGFEDIAGYCLPRFNLSFANTPNLQSVILNRNSIIGQQCFLNSAISDIEIPNMNRINSGSFTNTGLLEIIAPSVTLIAGNSNFKDSSSCVTIDIRGCTSLANAVTQTNVFLGCTSLATIYANPIMETINGGAPHAALTFAQVNYGTTIIYI